MAATQLSSTRPSLPLAVMVAMGDRQVRLVRRSAGTAETPEISNLMETLASPEMAATPSLAAAAPERHHDGEVDRFFRQRQDLGMVGWNYPSQSKAEICQSALGQGVADQHTARAQQQRVRDWLQIRLDDMDESRSGYDDVALDIDALLNHTADPETLTRWWRKWREATV
jgi:hypothetical protein